MSSQSGFPDTNGDRGFPATVGWTRRLDIGVLALLGIVAIVLRFWTRSPMWLDEALTVNIAQQPLHQIPEALRHDGHPPLYYFLLHGWMNLFGNSDQAIRALAGVFGVLTIPLTWLVGRRIGGRSVAWCATVVVATLPFAVRYATESRMYSLLMALALAGWLCADSALRKTRPLPLIGLAACTAALLWTQYWALWLGAAAATMVTWHLIGFIKRRDREQVRAHAWVLGALGVGAATFVPWIPTMLYQQAHTGTPWATRASPPTVIVTSIQALGGPPNAATEIAGWIVAVAIVLGIFGLGVGSGRIELDLATRRWSRPVLFVAGLTFGIGIAVMLATNSAFQPRYNSVWIPFAIVLAGIGLAILRGPLIQRGALALVLVASSYGCYQNITLPRTQSAMAAEAIERDATPGDIVGVCPDQLGPSLSRALGPGLEVGTFPHFENPKIVDWVDYVKRTKSQSPVDFAKDLQRRAGSDHRIFVVWSDAYKTHAGLCPEIVRQLAALRPDNRELLATDAGYFEHFTVTGFWPQPVP